ncbi:MAG: ammonium transporter [Nitrososphaerales archaeon]
MIPNDLVNNLWVLFAGVMVLSMAGYAGFLEVGSLGEKIDKALIKNLTIVGLALFFMAWIGFNIAFAPTINGVIGNPFYHGIFLGGVSNLGLFTSTWWSMTSHYFGSGLDTGTYYVFEASFAAVTLALVGLVGLRKMKMSAFAIYGIAYFIIIWTLPAAWIWNPTGWLYLLGVRDFAGGAVVHAAAGAAGLAILWQIWKEERAKGYTKSPQVQTNIVPVWLVLSSFQLLLAWLGFNAGSTLKFDDDAIIVVVSTLLSAVSGFLSTMFFRYVLGKKMDLQYATNGFLVGLIVITPLAGYVSPDSAVILGLVSGPIYLAADKAYKSVKWFTDPIGLLSTHMTLGPFGFIMTAFFVQNTFAVASGSGNLPNGLFFGGGLAALHQLGLQIFALVVVMVSAFVMTYIAMWILARLMHGITTDYKEQGMVPQEKQQQERQQADSQT